MSVRDEYSLMFLKSGLSTEGDTESVLLVGPSAPATNLFIPLGKKSKCEISGLLQVFVVNQEAVRFPEDTGLSSFVQHSETQKAQKLQLFS